MFGFFECEDDAEAWRRCSAPRASGPAAAGRARMLGPMDFTTNDEIGVLIDGYELRPMILEPWHPPYYRELIEAAGLRQGDGRADVGTDIRRPRGGRCCSTPRSTPRPRRRCTTKGSRSATCASATWPTRCAASWTSTTRPGGDNWGFVPITDAEVEFHAKNLQAGPRRGLGLHGRREGRRGGRRRADPARHQPGDGEAERPPAALRLAQVPARASARSTGCGSFALGVKHEYRHSGVAAGLYLKHLETAARTPARSRAARWAGSSRPTGR